MKMDCNKRKYCIDEILKKVEEGIELEHCEEVFYLRVHHGMTEEDAENLVYCSKES